VAEYLGRVLRYDDWSGWGWHNAHDWIPDAEMNVKPGPVVEDGTCRAHDNQGKAHRFESGYCVKCGVRQSDAKG
jgi:hypothetical protein